MKNFLKLPMLVLFLISFESLGVILTVNSEEVIEDVNNFVFSFDWEEL